MKQTINLLRLCGIIILTGATCHATVAAADPNPARSGALGQRYVRLTATGFRMEGVSPLDEHAVGWAFESNFPLARQWDVGLGYEHNRDGSLIGLTMVQRTINAAVTWYGVGEEWRPLVRASVGHRSWSVDGWNSRRTTSMTYAAAAGVEFQMARTFTLTPVLEYFDSPDLDDDSGWTASLNGEWRFARRWSVIAGLRRIEWVDDTAATACSLGVALHF